MISEQAKVNSELDRLVRIFVNSNATIRPHFILTGGSGTGKSHLIKQLTVKHEVPYFEINAAQLTKEGTSGNSLSKALTPLLTNNGQPSICFVDEFDKLFIAGNANDQHAQSYTTDVQNEFLKVLESDHAAVFGDYGRYVNARVDNVLFVFAGAFNGEPNMSIDKLRDFGVKTEFLGRVGLVYSTEQISLESMLRILEDSQTLTNFLQLFTDVKKKDVLEVVGSHLRKHHDKNTLGVRYIDNLLMQYFIKGGKLEEKVVEQISFNKTMTLGQEGNQG